MVTLYKEPIVVRATEWQSKLVQLRVRLLLVELMIALVIIMTT